jgi:type II secretory pathway pseudopilin PulG
MDTLHKQLTPVTEIGTIFDRANLARASRRRQHRNPAGGAPAPFQNCHRESGFHSPGAQRPSAFTLIESVVAIGIFAFVIVGIVGLYGAALDRQRQASFETRAVMVSQQILARIRAANSPTTISFISGSSGPTTENKLYHVTNASIPLNTNVFYYKKDGTEISGLLRADSYESSNYSFLGTPDNQPSDIVGRARTILTTNNTGSTNLYRVTIEVSEPANLPLSARRYTNTFTTYATLTN